MLVLDRKIASNSISAGALPQTPLESLQRSQGPVAVFKGPTSKGRQGKGEERVGKGTGREWNGTEWKGRTTLRTPCRKLLATPLSIG